MDTLCGLRGVRPEDLMAENVFEENLKKSPYSY